MDKLARMQANPSSPPGAYLTAREAAQLLDVQRQTLYAYVSRGLIRSVMRPGQKARLYLRADVERVHARALARAGHGAVAADAMNHGQAIIPTSITEITTEGPCYRGQLATVLVGEEASFEAVAELLWTGRWEPQAPVWPVTATPRMLVGMVEALRDAAGRASLLEVFALVVLQLGLQRRARRGVEQTMHEQARQIIQILVGCCGLASSDPHYVPMARGERVADALLRALGGEPSPCNRAAIGLMLTLLADHELMPGTLAVRVAASGGATLHACIGSALCTSSGLNVAHLYDDAHAFLAGGGKAILLRRALARHAAGRPLPGFGHALYPQGDPRGRVLLDFIRARYATRPLLAVCEAIEEIERATGLRVRHELPMVALIRAMDLGKEAASAIFVVARVAGWVAHIEEQRGSGQLMRPRARFVTPAAAGVSSGAASNAGLNNQS